jgi:hypothetical protein
MEDSGMYRDTRNPIDRHLGRHSFATHDPDAAIAWLHEIGATPIQTRGPGEAGRVRSECRGEVIVYTSGLIIALEPPAAEVRRHG